MLPALVNFSKKKNIYFWNIKLKLVVAVEENYKNHADNSIEM